MAGRAYIGIRFLGPDFRPMPDIAFNPVYDTFTPGKARRPKGLPQERPQPRSWGFHCSVHVLDTPGPREAALCSQHFRAVQTAARAL